MTDRLDLEREILAAVLGGGVPVLLALRRTPWDPSWLTGPRRLAVEAAEALAMRGDAPGPIAPDAIGAEIRRRASEDLAEEVRAAATDAVEAFGAGATTVEAYTEGVARLVDQLGDTSPVADATPGLLEIHGIVPISSVPREAVDWAWQGRFAYGKHTDVVGDPGDGKSLLVTALAAQITRGRPLPYGNDTVREPRAVLYLSAEDDAADTIRPRFEAAGGDVGLLYVQRDDRHLVLPDRAEVFQRILRELRAGMAIIDPLFSYIGDLDPNAYSSAVSVCDALKRIAAAEKCILTTVRHLNKALGAAARYRAGGSQGWGAKPRFTLGLARDKNDPATRVLTWIKGNVTGEPLAATFQTQEIVLPPGEGESVGVSTVQVRWGAERAISADEALGAEDAGPKEPTKTEVLAEWMRSQLAQAGPEGIPLNRLREDAMGSGLTRSPGRFYAARRTLDVVEFRANPDNPQDPIRLRLRGDDDRLAA